MIITEYRIPAPVTRTIAVAADLHEHPPDEALRILKKAAPDVIVVPGDTFERHGPGENLDGGDPSILSRLVCIIYQASRKFIKEKPDPEADRENGYRFLREAAKIAPVVMSRGNHEPYFTDEDRKLFEEAGIHFLENSMLELDGILFGAVPSKQIVRRLNRAFLRVFSCAKGAGQSENAGQSKNAEQSENAGQSKSTGKSESTGLSKGKKPGRRAGQGKTREQSGIADGYDENRRKKGYRILLCHHPEYYRELKRYPIDLIISGHAHGGQIRLFGRGVFAPGQGLFPRYHHGIYHGRLVVSSGLSNTAGVPRFGNPTEVVVLRLGQNADPRSR